MGLNWGIALGSAVKTGTDTYLKLHQEARDQELADQQKEQFGAWQKEQAQQASMASNYADTVGNASTTEKQAIPGTMGQSNLPDGQAGPVAQMQAVPYSDADKMADFQRKNAAAGIDPMKTLQVTGAARADRAGQRDDDFKSWVVKSQDEIMKDPVAWSKANLGAYNNPAKGGKLDDGMTAEVVKSADGTSHSFVQKDAKGNIAFSTPITTQSAQTAFKQMAFDKYTGVDFKGSAELDLKKQGVNLEGRKVQVLENESPSKINAANAAAGTSVKAGNYYDAHANEVNDKNKRANDVFETNKIYTDKIAALNPDSPTYEKDKYTITQEASAAVAAKTGDWDKVASNTPQGRLLKQFDDDAKARATAGSPPISQTAFMESKGFASPAATQLVKDHIKKLKEDGNEKDAQAIVDQFNVKYPESKLPASAGKVTPTAIPSPKKIKDSQAVRDAKGMVTTTPSAYKQPPRTKGITTPDSVNELK